MKDFVVIRIANKPDGTVAVPVAAFDNEVDALQTFYRQCAVAVDSDNLMDAVTLLHKEGYEIRHEFFTHTAPEPEVEPEPEENE